ncbi:MAG TPA: hypothetical protein VNR18_05180 [Hyphomicrobiales bacterium]|nr:hypothetical protein [Hyphomicrobiales bacterium]
MAISLARFVLVPVWTQIPVFAHPWKHRTVAQRRTGRGQRKFLTRLAANCPATYSKRSFAGDFSARLISTK